MLAVVPRHLLVSGPHADNDLDPHWARVADLEVRGGSPVRGRRPPRRRPWPRVRVKGLVARVRPFKPTSAEDDEMVPASGAACQAVRVARQRLWRRWSDRANSANARTC